MIHYKHKEESVVEALEKFRIQEIRHEILRGGGMAYQYRMACKGKLLWKNFPVLKLSVETGNFQKRCIFGAFLGERLRLAMGRQTACCRARPVCAVWH